MSEEEKKAIEFLKEIVLEFEKCNSEYVIDKDDKYGFLNSFKVVINLTEKQKKVIKHQRQQRKYWRDNFYEQQKEIAELMKICDLYKNASEHCAENFLKAIKPNYIGKDKIREIISNKRKKVLEKHNSKLSISKRIYKRNVQVAMLDTLLKELLEEK